MFNDKYGLTQAVLGGYKTMTRRIIPLSDTDKEYLDTAFDWDLREMVILDRYARYEIGETVAIAQSYETLANSGYLDRMIENDNIKKEYTGAGWSNKMFVRADLMFNAIQFTNRRIEHLQDITDEDCLREGIIEEDTPIDTGYSFFGTQGNWATPREAFACLIDKVSGRGTWDSNLYVIAYSYERKKI